MRAVSLIRSRKAVLGMGGRRWAAPLRAGVYALALMTAFSGAQARDARSSTAASQTAPHTAPAQPAPPQTTIVNEQVFGVAYSRLVEAYFTPVDLGRLGVDGLRGLRTIDPAVSVERTGPILRVYVSGSLAGEYALPPTTDAVGWAALTARAIAAVRVRSTALRSAPAERLYQAVLDGVTGGLDSFSRYTGAQRATRERAQRDGYGGIGLTLTRMGDRYLVGDVLPRTPAFRAGIQPGDILVAIDGAPAGPLDESAIRDLLRGPSGSIVVLTVGKDGTLPRFLPLKRERMVPNTVTLTVAEGIAVLKVDRFNAATTANLRESLLLARGTSGLRGIILDLRGNPGGLLDQAVAVADLFMTHGRILTTEGRHPDSHQRFDATPEDVAEGLPLAVLVDSRSASSAEIVAAALQDSGRGVVVGATTYGKGSVQTVSRLPNDGELFLTWSRIVTPAGYTLHRQGVLPVICTSLDGADPLDELNRNGTTVTVQNAALRTRAAEDEDTLARLRAVCPWREHESSQDESVARRLLTHPDLYRRAVQTSGTTVAERG